MRRALVLAMAAISIVLSAASDDPAERLTDPALERRAEHLFEELRCVRCQNESIAASQADIAHTMRGLVRQQIAAGKSDTEVRAYMYDRYGDFVLLRPRLTPATLFLWGLPFVILLGGLGLVLTRRRTPALLEDGLTAKELASLKALETKSKNDGPA